MRILVCEDDPARRDVVAAVLAERGHQPIPLSAAESLTALAGGLLPDLILYDWLMPQSWELRLLLERSPALAELPLLGMKRAADPRAIADEADAALTGQPPPRPPDRLALSRRADQIKSLAKLAADLPDSPELRAETERLARLADRAGAMAEYVRTFGWPSTKEAAVLDIRRPLNLALEVVLPELRHRARLAIELDEAPRVRVVEQQVAHCFFDLLMNAVQAIDKGAPERNLIEVSTCGREDGFALVTVRDSGCGMPQEMLPRIFDPMFTTKSSEGQGLGLYLVQVTMASLGGEIFVDSEPGQGSIFTLAFPPADLS